MTFLPTTVSDGRKVIAMDDEQKYAFDLKGWLLLPNLIDRAQAHALRDHLIARAKPDVPGQPPIERDLYAGPVQALFDHPAIVGVLNEIVSFQQLAAEEAYGFRLENVFETVRTVKGSQDGGGVWSPHGGGALHAFVGNSHIYQHRPGKIYAGLVRVVWEFEDVARGEGGTLFISGSHKAAFPRPPGSEKRDWPLWEDYACPAGSALVFTEAITHTGTPWLNPNHSRVALFCSYNTITEKWHPGGPAHDVIMQMPEKRRTLFRGNWTGTARPQINPNLFYSETNRAP